jgi:hypothetical protein
VLGIPPYSLSLSRIDNLSLFWRHVRLLDIRPYLRPYLVHPPSQPNPVSGWSKAFGRESLGAEAALHNERLRRIRRAWLE